MQRQIWLWRRDRNVADTLTDEIAEQLVKVSLLPQIGALREHQRPAYLNDTKQLSNRGLGVGEVGEHSDTCNCTKRAVGELERIVQVEFDDVSVDPS